jgi:phenylacetate-coenzyme A ligase PaaK-like adenylate-forming protein
LDTFESFERLIYTANDRTFDEIAVRLFQFQAVHNKVYAEYLQHLDVDPTAIKTVAQIPFLPITFFKSRNVKTGNWQEDIVFTSSGTTGAQTSRHFALREFYLDNAGRCFSHFFGPPENFVFLALLPGYLGREGSSLIAMLDHFIRLGGKQASGFYKESTSSMREALEMIRRDNVPAILWGVTHALLDLSETGNWNLGQCMVVETGGMKGMKAEVTREELQALLTERLGVPFVSSEYGMTELMSQAYAIKGGLFEGPPWMRVLIRDPEDPLGRLPGGRTGGINVIDLANIRSCAFVETEDLGRQGENHRFEVLGRMDNSDIRGCNLLG